MMIKSIILGLGIFVVGSIAYLVFELLPLGTTGNMVVGVIDLGALTIWNVWFWIWLVASLGIGYGIVRRANAGA
jgi:hypothetical protein